MSQSRVGGGNGHIAPGYGGAPPPYPPVAPTSCPPPSAYPYAQQSAYAANYPPMTYTQPNGLYATASPPNAYPHAQPAPYAPSYPEPLQIQTSGSQDPKTVYGRTASTSAGSNGMAPTASFGEMLTDQVSVQIRHAFVRKVLAILSLQILITFGVAATFGFVPVLSKWLLKNSWLLIISVVLALVLQIAVACVPSLGRKVPLNFFLLTMITLCYSVLIAYGAAATSVQSFLIAVGSTFAVCVALMIFACQVKYDFTGWGSYIVVALVVLMIFGIVSIFIRTHIMHTVYAAISALLFSFVLVYDTQQVVGGKHRKFQYSVDDYIFAALALYIDVIVIFMNILALTDS